MNPWLVYTLFLFRVHMFSFGELLNFRRFTNIMNVMFRNAGKSSFSLRFVKELDKKLGF